MNFSGSHTLPSHANISCLILAGGKGRRVGGRDKGLLLYKDLPLIEHVIGQVMPQVAEIIINANRHYSDYQKLGYVVVDDNAHSSDYKMNTQQISFSGPLSGIYAAVPFCHHAFILVVPCDMPLLPSNLIENLCLAFIQKNATIDLSIAQADGFLQPVFLMRKDCYLSIASNLKNQQFRLMHWLKSQRFSVVDFSEAKFFKNCNFKTDF